MNNKFLDESQDVSFKEIKKVKKLLNKKNQPSVKVLIDSVDAYLPIFTDITNSSIRNGTIPEELKLAEVAPLFKKADPSDKVNYRPVSLLSHVSKVYENYFQSNQYMLWTALF